MKKDRVTVSEAADRLGVKEQAVRKRIQRGTLVHDKDEYGRVYVYLDPRDEADSTSNAIGKCTYTGTETDTLVQSLQDQIEYLRAELQRRGETHAEESRRKDHIIAALTERIPELPSAPAQEATDAPETASPRWSDRGTAPEDPQEPTERRSWLVRFFFGP